MKEKPFYAHGLTVVVGPDHGVYVEMRDAAGKVRALAGLKVCAAVDFNEQLTKACEQALSGRPSAEAVH